MDMTCPVCHESGHEMPDPNVMVCPRYVGIHWAFLWGADRVFVVPPAHAERMVQIAREARGEEPLR